MTVFRVFILLLLCMAASFMALNSYQQWQWLASAQTEQNSLLGLTNSIFRDQQLETLKAEAAELNRELEFNLWPDQQQTLALKLNDNIKRRIERRPFYAQNWLELINVQQQYTVHQDEYSWNLSNALLQNSWQIKAFTQLAYHCIHQKRQLQELTSKQCKELLSQPYAATVVGNVKYHLGIEMAEFERILTQARSAP